ncbi:MAG: hypothetical protein OEY59_13670 [Deltaproteobacteria bacterium]|nr:hypothetical protein [Deltaproteobacteria bacterium]
MDKQNFLEELAKEHPDTLLPKIISAYLKNSNVDAEKISTKIFDELNRLFAIGIENENN